MRLTDQYGPKFAVFAGETMALCYIFINFLIAFFSKKARNLG